MDMHKLREDFPVLQKQVKGKPIIYFDNACMTLKPKQVVERMDQYYYEFPACAGRSVHRLSTQVGEACELARRKVAKFIGAKSEKEIIWTRNTTEGINLIANSLDLKAGDAVLTTDKEHNSNLLPWLLLKERKRIKHLVVQSEPDGSFNFGRYVKQLTKDVKLVSMVHTSNLDGVTIPAKEIIEAAHEIGALVLLDCAQSVPHKPVNVRNLGADFVAFSIHKMCGPTGMGVLYGKKELLEELNPFLVGGDTVSKTTYDSYELLPVPERFEAGLQNYAGIIGAGAAVDYVGKIIWEVEEHEYKINKYITDELSKNPKIKILGPADASKRSGIFSFVVDGLDYHQVALLLDETANIEIRSGQHCVHSWFNAQGLKGSARASFYFYNTLDEAKVFVETLNKIAKTFA